MELQMMVPEEKELFFVYGVRVGFGQFGFLQEPDIVYDGFPSLSILHRYRNESSLYDFHNRDNRFAIFINSESQKITDDYLELKQRDNIKAKLVYDHYIKLNMFKSIPLDEWLEGFALYFDYLAAKDIELNIGRAGEGKTSYHVVLDQRDINGSLLGRRLLCSMYSRQAASYVLRRHRLWQEYLWRYYNIRDLYAESVFTKHRHLTKISDSDSDSTMKVLVEYPHSRGRRRPYERYWHWHISRTVPLIESGRTGNQDEQDRDDERWIHRPGDPKLLRETGSGLFGSYPSYEGDDEPEYRDEN